MSVLAIGWRGGPDYPPWMNKRERIAGLVGDSEEGVDPFYAGYFARFNEGKFYEAHDVLEQLWLPQRQGANGNFYKGLIQLAGAYAHLQKSRPGPAAALFKLAKGNLEKYPAQFERLDVAEVLERIGKAIGELERGGNPLEGPPVELKLLDASSPLPSPPQVCGGEGEED